MFQTLRSGWGNVLFYVFSFFVPSLSSLSPLSSLSSLFSLLSLLSLLSPLSSLSSLSSLFFSLLSSGAHEWAMSGLWAFLISSGSRPDLVQMSSKTSTHTFETCSFPFISFSFPNFLSFPMGKASSNFELWTFHHQGILLRFQWRRHFPCSYGKTI